ncbi:MAG: ABC transporter permease [Thermomicrobiales bacterium]|nr:ABC transporter permease [Thermomicrobiales bacterium]
MQQLLRSEIFRSRKRAQTWIMIALVLGLVILLYGGLTIAHIVRPSSDSIIDSLRLSNIYDNGLAIVSIVGSIVAIVYGSSLIGSEFSWNTLRPLLARARSRASLLSAKWLTVGIYTLVVSALGVLASMVSAVVGSLIAGEETGVSAGTVVDYVAVSLRVTGGLLPYAVMAMFIALLMRSNAAGIAIGIALSFVEPILFAILGQLSDIFDTIQKGGISWNTNRLMIYGGDNDITLSNVWASTGAVAVWIALFMALSYWIFGRRDVTSG